MITMELTKFYNQNHQLNWWFAQALKGLPTGSPTESRH